jgi:mRNA interferase RelE/StbE
MYEIEYHRQIFKDLDKIPGNFAEKIIKVIKELAGEPFPWGYKKISGKLNAYRVRVGDYRVIYIVSQQENKIRIIRVRHRKDVYHRIDF